MKIHKYASGSTSSCELSFAGHAPSIYHIQYDICSCLAICTYL